jgi:putative transcriptional regulator
MATTPTFKNRFLIAMPRLNDPYFHQTVILIFEHSEKGAMGLIINKPLEISIGEILQHLNIPLTHSEMDKDKVMLGGPVASEQGFIIHTYPELCPGDIIDADSQITVSASKEVLQHIVEKQPDNILICLGYAAWKEGQLEQEIADNSWMLSDVNADILFSLPYQERWKASAKLLGVDLDRLSSDVGHG